MFRAWYKPFYDYGVIHGDPHLGNYTVRPDLDVNLLDFGCIRDLPADVRQGCHRPLLGARHAATATSPSSLRDLGLPRPQAAR